MRNASVLRLNGPADQRRPSDASRRLERLVWRQLRYDIQVSLLLKSSGDLPPMALPQYVTVDFDIQCSYTAI